MTPLRARAWLREGQWIANCPRPGCPNAEHFGADPLGGHVGGLTGASFHCRYCHLRVAAQWPPNVDDINWLTSQRPIPRNRNWHVGETLDDLWRENLAHGILPPQLGPGLVLSITGDRIDGGNALPSGYLAAIGGGPDRLG